MHAVLLAANDATVTADVGVPTAVVAVGIISVFALLATLITLVVTQINRHIDKVSNDVEALRKAIEEGFQKIEQRVEALSSQISVRFDKMEERQQQLDIRLVRVEEAARASRRGTRQSREDDDQEGEPKKLTAPSEESSSGEALSAQEARLRRRADAGDVSAANNLAMLLHRKGEGAEAERYWQRAAANGSAAAMNNLAVEAAHKDDLETARRLWTDAARAGHTPALMNLGKAAQRAGDNDEAEQWFRAAVDAGDRNGMAANSLAEVLRDKGATAEAEFWFRSAAAQGYREASKSLSALIGRSAPVPDNPVDSTQEPTSPAGAAGTASFDLVDLMSLLTEAAGLPVESQTSDPSAGFVDVGLDPLAFLAMQTGLQDRYGVEIPDDKPDHYSFGEIVELVQEQLGVRAARERRL